MVAGESSKERTAEMPQLSPGLAAAPAGIGPTETASSSRFRSSVSKTSLASGEGDRTRANSLRSQPSFAAY